MLQQTTVATVQSRFKRFLAAFPTVEALAAADEQEVLRQWEGLGYYRRARNLHAAAKRLVAEHGAQLPDDPAVWAALPGVGRYILGAVLSQAFDRRMPIVEANSQRVLCRLFGHASDPAASATRKWLWQTAEAILPRRRVGDFNQALMELGALVCKPSGPSCGDCPVADHCVAYQNGLQERIPLKTVLPSIVDVREIAIVVRRRGRVLLVRLPQRGRYSNMWEFPRFEICDREECDAAAVRLLRELTGLTAKLGPELLTIRHGVMHYRITMTCIEADYTAGRFRSSLYTAARWPQPAELDHFPVSSPQRKLARLVAAAERQRRLF